jgi:hypothetical protein
LKLHFTWVSLVSTQCAKDCGPYNCACKYWRLCFLKLKPNFNICALTFFPHAKNQAYQSNMQKNIMSIFLTIKAMIQADTHGIYHKSCSQNEIGEIGSTAILMMRYNSVFNQSLINCFSFSHHGTSSEKK